MRHMDPLGGRTAILARCSGKMTTMDASLSQPPRHFGPSAAVLVALLLGGPDALAQSWPAKTVRIVVPFAPGVLVVNPALPAQDLKQFIAYAKKEPGKLAYGSPGNGTQGHLIAEQLKQVAGIEMTHVPYKGASLAVADLIAGHVPVTSTTLTTAATQIKAGKARALAVSSAKRVPDFPDLPTFGELGYPELTASIWFSLSGPAGTPAEVVSRLNAEVRRILHLPDVRERLRPEGIEPGDLDPRQFAAYMAAEVKRWAPVVHASGAKAD